MATNPAGADALMPPPSNEMIPPFTLIFAKLSLTRTLSRSRWNSLMMAEFGMLKHTTHLEGVSVVCMTMAPLGIGGVALLESFRSLYGVN